MQPYEVNEIALNSVLYADRISMKKLTEVMIMATLYADEYKSFEENNKRLVVRGNIRQWNLLLAEAANNAGVITDLEKMILTTQSA